MNLLILDDFSLEALQAIDRKELLEIVEDRHKLKLTLITRQLAVKHWHEHIGEPTLADVILDCLMNHAYKIELMGCFQSARYLRSAFLPNFHEPLLTFKYLVFMLFSKLTL